MSYLSAERPGADPREEAEERDEHSAEGPCVPREDLCQPRGAGLLGWGWLPHLHGGHCVVKAGMSGACVRSE